MEIDGAILMISSVGLSYLEISVNICALEAFQGSNISTWLQFIYGCFGFGGLLGPILVYMF